MTLKPIIKCTYRGLECEGFKTSNCKLLKISDLLSIKNDFVIIVDFSIVKFSIIEQILLSGKYHLKENAKDKNMSYDIKSNYIKLFNGNDNVLIMCSYENKFMQDFIDFNTAMALESMDTEKQTTCTKDSKKQFLKTISKRTNYFAQSKVFDKIFPQFEEKEFFYNYSCKKSVTALMYCELGEYDNIYSYDIKSSFPSRVYYDFFPSGSGRFFKSIDEVPSNKWYICKIKIFNLKVKLFDILDIMQSVDEYGFLTYFATKEVLEIIDICYDCEYEIQDGYYYTLQKSIFDKFLQENFFNPLNKNTSFKKYNKAKNNLLFGNFGRNDKIYNTVYEINGDKLIQKKEVVELDDKGYYPLFLYVNGMSKLEILKIVLPYMNDIVYINTDGFFSKRKINFTMYNIDKVDGIGRVEFRALYNKVCVKDISNYFALFVDEDGVIHNDVRLSGRKTNVDNYFDFVNGNFKSLFCRFTQYGFIDFFEENERPLSFYVEYKKYVSNIEKLQKYKFLTIKNREKFEAMKTIVKKEKQLELIKQIYDSLDNGELEEVTDIFIKNQFSNRAFKVKVDFSCKDKRYKKYDIVVEDELDSTTIKELLKNKYIKEI